MSSAAESPAAVAPAPLRFGKLYDEPIEVYHGGDAISKTRLDTFRYSPRLFFKRHVAKVLPKEPPGEPLIIGSAVDALALDGEAEFNRRFIVGPADAPKRPTKKQLEAKKPSDETKAAIEFWRAFDASVGDRHVLDADQLSHVQRMVAALRANATFSKLLGAGRTQVTFRLKGDQFAMQCRPDIWLEDGCDLTQGMPCIVDLKTVHSLPADEPDHLPRHIGMFGYHRAAYVYREIVSTVMGYGEDYRPPFVLAFVEKAEPHAVVTHVVDDLAIEIGEREVREDLRRLKFCIKSGRWPESWNTDLSPIGLTNFYVRRALEGVEPDLF